MKIMYDGDTQTMTVTLDLADLEAMIDDMSPGLGTHEVTDTLYTAIARAVREPEITRVDGEIPTDGGTVYEGSRARLPRVPYIKTRLVPGAEDQEP